MSRFIILALLLALPGAALVRLSRGSDWRVCAVIIVALSLVAYLAIRGDKRRAQRGQWRIAESILHLTELAGGWPGSFIAQRQFRHKIVKTRYQVTFWLIVLLHQLVALDFLLGFRIVKSMWH